MEKIVQIAIDGPAGAGKSTVAKKLAKKMNILYLDTGAMYRAVTYYGMQHGIKGDDDRSLEPMLDQISIDFDGEKLLLNNEDVSELIRRPEVEKEVSVFASNPLVRNRLVEMQRKIAQGRSVVMEGRDIGTVVLKDTPYKFYLDANVDVRAMRRHEQHPETGLDETRHAIQKRDQIDQNRLTDPLTIAEGSIVIDTSNISIDEVIERILNNVEI